MKKREELTNKNLANVSGGELTAKVGAVKAAKDVTILDASKNNTIENKSYIENRLDIKIL